MRQKINKALLRKIESLVRKKTKIYSWRPKQEEWLQRRTFNEKFQEFRFNFINKYVPNFRKRSILDIGCGMGGLVTFLKCKGAKNIVGIDVDYDYCLISKLRGKKFRLLMPVVNGRGEKMPFKSKAFDLILCFEVLEHVSDYRSVLREIIRLLESGGKAIVTFSNRLAWEDPHYHWILINWLPRRMTETFLSLLGRKKLRFCDRQKLSDMNYVYYWQIKKELKELGFTTTDLLGEELTRYENIKNRWMAVLVYLLARAGLAGFFYSLFAFFYLDTFQFLIDKREEGSTDSGKTEAI